MIKEEHIRQAIHEISLRDQGIARYLSSMLSEGTIAAPSGADGGGDLSFFFGGERVPVRRYLFFDHGTVPIEQGLLIKYGEFMKRKTAGSASQPTGSGEVAEAIRTAGLRLAVTHEIDYATARAEGLLRPTEPRGRHEEPSPAFGLTSLLKELRADDRPFEMSEEVDRSAFVYRGVVSKDTPACFLPFPMRKETLMQVADLNLEYFSIRFILDCLIRGTLTNLMACVVGQRIVGLLYLELRKRYLKEALEIKFHATLRGREQGTTGTSLKGVGSFLVAGVWMVRANHLPHVKEIFLDSEAGARRFYESLGFVPRGFSGYILKEPKGFMLNNLLTMAAHCRDLKQDVIEDLEKLVRNQVKDLQKKVKSLEDRADRGWIDTQSLDRMERR
ncbi:MAG: hypothetical protein JXL84_06215 [Deltaproteobacteria bacterium]|nr:hypothetical protein [Deltaproteobacteria bacterium]